MPDALATVLFSSLISLLPPLPAPTSVGINLGFSPATAGTGLFFAYGYNQVNLGAFYGVGTDEPDLTDVLVGISYNRYLTDWGLFAATGLVLTYTARTTLEDRDPNQPETGAEGTAWQGARMDDPFWIFELGQSLAFGSRDQFGVHVDAGAAAELDSDGRNPWSPIAGIGISYRFQFD